MESATLGGGKRDVSPAEQIDPPIVPWDYLSDFDLPEAFLAAVFLAKTFFVRAFFV